MLIFLFLGGLHCTGSSSPPGLNNVIFSSVNLRNMLHWFPGNGAPDDTHFTVQYAIYGDSVVDSKGRRLHWRRVPGCTEIMRRWCDLSSETWDLEQGYYARVHAVSRRASSKWVLTGRFDPKLDTSFGPPMVSVEIEDNNAIITLKGPMRYQPNNDTPVVSMATLYPQMMYNLSINNSGRGQTSHFPVDSSPYIYRLMDYDTEYCFSAKAKFLSMPIQCQSSALHCIRTPPDPMTGQLQKVVVGIAVPSVCAVLLGLAGYHLYHYLMGKGQRTPRLLKLPHVYPPPPTFPPENCSLILIAVIQQPDIKRGISEPACPMQQQHIADPPPYVPQGSSTPQEPEEPWDDVSIDYGFVGVAPKIDDRGGEEDRKRSYDGGENENNLKRKYQKHLLRHSYEEKEWGVQDGHSAEVYCPQEKSYLSQKSTHTCSQTHMLIHTQAEISTLIQAHACLPVNPVTLTQTQAPLLPFQGGTKGEADREEEDREFSGLFINKTPNIGLFHFPLNLQTKTEEGMGEEMDRKVRVRTDGEVDGVREGSKSERAPLLSAYVSQNKDMSTSHTDQSGFLPDDYSVLRLATARNIDKDDEEEEGTLCVDWDPKTRKLVLPEIAVEFTKAGWLDNLMQGEKRKENRVEGEEEEVNVMKGRLMLENVFVRQASEVEEEAERELEKGGEGGCEVQDILNKWNLIISMDQ